MKPIETIYRGYKFRSRLEARWAVFYDALSIHYRYEPEGYDLDGVRYLPDFWLPQLDCFVEIKGQEPTVGERQKAELLALHSRKDVYLSCGDIWFPAEHGTRTRMFYGGWTLVAMSIVSGTEICELSLPESLAIPLCRIWNAGVQVCVAPFDDIVFARSVWRHEIHSFGDWLRMAQEQTEVLPSLFEEIRRRQEELVRCGEQTAGKEFAIAVDGGGVQHEMEWYACKHCHGVGFQCTIPGFSWVGGCKCAGEFEQDEERLRVAYTAARQARFGKGNPQGG